MDIPVYTPVMRPGPVCCMDIIITYSVHVCTRVSSIAIWPYAYNIAIHVFVRVGTGIAIPVYIE